MIMRKINLILSVLVLLVFVTSSFENIENETYAGEAPYTEVCDVEVSPISAADMESPVESPSAEALQNMVYVTEAEYQNYTSTFFGCPFGDCTCWKPVIKPSCNCYIYVYVC